MYFADTRRVATDEGALAEATARSAGFSRSDISWQSAVVDMSPRDSVTESLVVLTVPDFESVLQQSGFTRGCRLSEFGEKFPDSVARRDSTVFDLYDRRQQAGDRQTVVVVGHDQVGARVFVVDRPNYAMGRNRCAES